MNDNEWNTWSQQFETALAGKPRCLYARQEGPHRTACLKPATGRSKDHYPACDEHQRETIRRRWRGYVRGA